MEEPLKNDDAIKALKKQKQELMSKFAVLSSEIDDKLNFLKNDSLLS